MKLNLGAIKSKLKPLFFYLKYNAKSDRKFVEKYFPGQLGYDLNLQDPKTFNEKLQWLKLNDREPTKTLLADKLAVRDFVKVSIGEEYLIPLVAKTTNIEDITPDFLPDYPVIIKCNHSSGKVFIVKDKHNMDTAELKAGLQKQLNYNLYHSLREWQYKNIPPCIIVEQLLTQEDGEVPDDYKVHCFSGKAKFIQLDTERFKGHKRRVYDRDWQPLDFEYNFPLAEPIAAPSKLPELLRLAEQLAKPFNYCRIDLYVVKDRIYFGEFTFTPEGGFGKFTPTEVDKQWGQLFEVGNK